MNEKIFYFFYNFAHQNSGIDQVIVFLADKFPYIVIFGAGIFLLFHHEVFKAESPVQILKQKYKEIALVFIAGALAWTLAHVLKYFIHTARPFETLNEVTSLFEKTGYSFPSGHAAFYMALAFAIFFNHKKAGYVFAVVAFIVGAARMAAGIHYPIDILGGFVLGALVALLARVIYDKFAYRERKI